MWIGFSNIHFWGKHHWCIYWNPVGSIKSSASLVRMMTNHGGVSPTWNPWEPPQGSHEISRVGDPKGRISTSHPRTCAINVVCNVPMYPLVIQHSYLKWQCFHCDDSLQEGIFKRFFSSDSSAPSQEMIRNTCWISRAQKWPPVTINGSTCPNRLMWVRNLRANHWGTAHPGNSLIIYIQYIHIHTCIYIYMWYI